MNVDLTSKQQPNKKLRTGVKVLENKCTIILKGKKQFEYTVELVLNYNSMHCSVEKGY